MLPPAKMQYILHNHAGPIMRPLVVLISQVSGFTIYYYILFWRNHQAKIKKRARNHTHLPDPETAFKRLLGAKMLSYYSNWNNRGPHDLVRTPDSFNFLINFHTRPKLSQPCTARLLRILDFDKPAIQQLGIILEVDRSFAFILTFVNLRR